MNKNTFSNRVTWYNFILCIFVVWIHAQNTDLFTEVVMIEGKPLFNQIEQTIVSDIAVVGVAGFFLCSGYLFYRNYSWGKVLEKYKTRFVGLFIPYEIWTLLYYFIHVGVSYITPLRAVFNEPPITVTWKGIVDAVLNYRYCAFLWFLQFLILLVVLSPLIYLLISNKYMGIVAIVLVLVIDSTGICGDLAFGSVQAQAFCNWLFIYMTGGYIGIHGSGAVESKNTSWLLLLASVILAVLAYYFFKYSPSMFTNLMYLLLFAAALWCLVCKLPLPMAANWQKHTFIVYMTHFLIVRGMNVLVSKYLSASMWPGILLFFLLPVLCFALTSLFWRICGKGQSFVWKMLSGNR